MTNVLNVKIFRFEIGNLKNSFELGALTFDIFIHQSTKSILTSITLVWVGPVIKRSPNF